MVLSVNVVNGQWCQLAMTGGPQHISLQTVFRTQLVLDSGSAPRGRPRGPAVVEHDEAATKATRVLVGVNRG